MKKVKLLFILSMVSFSNCVIAQTDSIRPKAKLDYAYLGLGGGASFRGGGIFGINSTFIYTNNWGFGINLNSNVFTAVDLPDDYVPETDIFFSDYPNPKDELTIISFPAIKEFTLDSTVMKVGIEAGPSIVAYRKTKFTPIHQSSWFDSNYITSDNTELSLGLCYALKADLWISKQFGAEFVFTGNLNSLRSIFGFELFLQYKIYKRTRK